MRETERESATQTSAAAPSLDLVFELLSVRRRRYVLYFLNDLSDGVTTVDEIVDFVVDHENADEDTRTDVLTSLQHVHLPKLQDAGLIEHDSRSDAVRYWNQPSVEEWLEHARYKELS